MKRLELQIHGHVQGVAFRWSAQREAQALGLTGWVRNRIDGTVLLVAEGDPDVLEHLLAWSENGPVHARVDRVDADWAEATGDFATFEVTG
jgi:acylphosphatase